jgi:signal peptidase I
MHTDVVPAGYTGTRRRTRNAGARRRPPGPAVAVPLGAVRRGTPFLLAAAVTGALLVLGVLCLVAVGPRLLGWHATTVMSNSMAPALHTGDIVVTAPADAGDLAVGDVVRFDDPARPQRQILHRVVGTDASGMIHTAGDANPGADSSPVAVDDIDGVARVQVPALGLPVIWSGSHPALAGGLALALVALALPLLRRHRPRGPRAVFGVTAAGFIAACVALMLGWQTSTAAFVASTTNPANAFTAGAITISDDDGGDSPSTGTAMFTVTGLTAAAPATSRCLTVTYTGNVAAPVKLYATGLTGSGLGTYLNFTVEVGSGGGFGSCTGFSSSSTPYNGTLAGYAGAYTSYATGLGCAWTPTTNGNQKVFRITYQLQNNPAAVGLSAGVNLVWEAQG